MLRFSKIFITVAVILYSIPLTTWLSLRSWKGESWINVGFMNAVGIWWFAPLLLLLPLALLVRARQASLICFIMLVPAFLIFGGEFVPRFSLAESEEGRRIRVLSFNALISNRSYNDVITLIEQHQPDLIALQELSPQMAEEISTRLADEYPHQQLYSWSDPRGIGLWSRYPLSEGPAGHTDWWPNWMQSASIDVEGQAIYLLNVHLAPVGTLNQSDFARALLFQHAQVRAIHDLLSPIEMPVLLVGDFNASPTNETYRLLDEKLDDAWRQVGFGPGFTFPAPETPNSWLGPFLRIDYFWTRGEIRPVKIEILPPAGSDHLPLLGEFILP
jgi:endonuclease/exonuclease/phosphatase (EEP) superfamily protein YafD